MAIPLIQHPNMDVCLHNHELFVDNDEHKILYELTKYINDENRCVHLQLFSAVYCPGGIRIDDYYGVMRYWLRIHSDEGFPEIYNFMGKFCKTTRISLGNSLVKKIEISNPNCFDEINKSIDYNPKLWFCKGGKCCDSGRIL